MENIKYTFDTTTNSSEISTDNVNNQFDTTKEQYEKDLKIRQEEHLKHVQENMGQAECAPQMPWQPCMHDSCTECQGTGIKHDGSMCVHMISCPCPKCSTYC